MFLVWSGRVLSAKRIARQDLMPFGVLGAVLLAVYSVGATVYVPHLFNTYATRYGVIGAVFAMISALFCVMVVLVGSAAAGREVRDELDRIRRGERPAEDEVRRQWDEVTAQARSRWETLREQIEERRRSTPGALTPGSMPDGQVSYSLGDAIRPRAAIRFPDPPGSRERARRRACPLRRRT